MYLADIEHINIGFVSRSVQNDDRKHSILKIYKMTRKELGDNINFKMTECWQVVKYLVNFFF